MARFKYLGEPERAAVVEYGPCTMIKLRKTDGTVAVLEPVSPAIEFVVDEDIGYDITDERSLRYLRVDSRFEEI